MTEKSDIVLSAGPKYSEIDGYASTVAMSELLTSKGSKPTVLRAPQNYSIPREYLDEKLVFTDKINDGDRVIILDTSNPEYIQDGCLLDNVIEIYDHHPGNEKFWKERLDGKSHIEPIGAVATQMFEKWQEESDISKMSDTTARLLAAAILDNTLNFNAEITTDRDRDVYKKLTEKVGKDITDEYFDLVSKNVEADLENAINDDMKRLNVSGFGDIDFGQLTIGKARDSLRNEIENIMNGKSDKWVFNLIDISAGKSIILASDDHIRQFFTNVLGDKRMLLRKEFLIEANRMMSYDDGGAER